RILDGFVKDDLGEGGVQVEGAVPGPSNAAVEAAALGTRIGISGIYDAKIGYAKDQFIDAYAGRQATLGGQALIGGSIEREQVGQMLGAGGQRRQDGIFGVGKARRQQPACVWLAYRRQGRQSHYISVLFAWLCTYIRRRQVCELNKQDTRHHPGAH